MGRSIIDQTSPPPLTYYTQPGGWARRTALELAESAALTRACALLWA